MLILSISQDLNKLLEDSSMTSITPLSKLCRVVIMTVDLIFVLIVAVLRPKDRGTNRASEVLDMIFPFQSSDVGSTKSSSTSETE